VLGDQVSMVAEIDVPKDLALDQLQIDLQHATADAGLQVRLQHHRLFIATNEIAFRRLT
jgi:predicted amino acid-binding ACT domain protein